MSAAPALGWRRTADGRMEVYAGAERTPYQIMPAFGGPGWVGSHFGLAPPIGPGEAAPYASPRDALAALERHLSRQRKAA